MEVAHVRQTEPKFLASGTQLGVAYELRYWLEPDLYTSNSSGSGASIFVWKAQISSIWAGRRSSTRCR